MFDGERYIEPQIIQRLLFCPKCKFEISGEKESGYIEIEYEYCV